jgi:hypothetical protein
LDKLKEVDAVLWVPVHDFFSLDVAEIILKYLLTKKVNERLNVFGHLSNILSSRQLREIDFRESCLEELNVELITEEYCDVINGLLHTQVPEDLISKLNYHLHDYIILFYFQIWKKILASQ